MDVGLLNVARHASKCRSHLGVPLKASDSVTSQVLWSALPLVEDERLVSFTQMESQPTHIHADVALDIATSLAVRQHIQQRGLSLVQAALLSMYCAENKSETADPKFSGITLPAPVSPIKAVRTLGRNAPLTFCNQRIDPHEHIHSHLQDNSAISLRCFLG